MEGKGGCEAKRTIFRKGLAGEQKRGLEVRDGRKTRGTETWVERSVRFVTPVSMIERLQEMLHVVIARDNGGRTGMIHLTGDGPPPPCHAVSQPLLSLTPMIPQGDVLCLLEWERDARRLR